MDITCLLHFFKKWLYSVFVFVNVKMLYIITMYVLYMDETEINQNFVLQRN